MQNKLALIAAAIVLSACSSEPDFAAQKSGLIRTLKDPSSVEFQGVVSGKNGRICGEFNAKNEYGGRVGFQRFIADEHGSAVEIDKTRTVEWSAERKSTADITAEVSREAQHIIDLGRMPTNAEAHRREFEALWRKTCT